MAKMRKYAVQLTGMGPLLMHADNIEWSDRMDRWKNDPTHKKQSKAGDDRSPGFRWLGSLYHNGQVVTIPADNLMRCFMEGGAMVPVPGGRGGKTFKAQTQSGMVVDGDHWTLLVGDKAEPVPMAPLLALQQEGDFDKHVDAADRLGFELFVKRAKIGASKHVRVRPRFNQWQAHGTLSVWDDQITSHVLHEIATTAGEYKGIGDWRPGGRTPGAFGRFTATVKEA